MPDLSRRRLFQVTATAVAGTYTVQTLADAPPLPAIPPAPPPEPTVINPDAYHFKAAYMVIHAADGTPLYKSAITNAYPVLARPGDSLTIEAKIEFT